MKKILVALLVVLLLMTMFAPLAFAQEGNNRDNDNKPTAEEKQEAKSERQEKKDAIKTRIEERKAVREKKMTAFRERMLQRKELREASKEELKAQRVLVQEVKLQLKDLRASLEGLTDEERAAYHDEIVALRQSIKDTHKQKLEIARAYREQIKEIFPGVRTDQAPTVPEVEEAVTAANEL